MPSPAGLLGSFDVVCGVGQCNKSTQHIGNAYIYDYTTQFEDKYCESFDPNYRFNLVCQGIIDSIYNHIVEDKGGSFVKCKTSCDGSEEYTVVDVSIAKRFIKRRLAPNSVRTRRKEHKQAEINQLKRITDKPKKKLLAKKKAKEMRDKRKAVASV